jgi:hypothetical protein
VSIALENRGGKIFFGDLGLDPPYAAASLVKPEDDEAGQDEPQEPDDAEPDDQKRLHGTTLSFLTKPIETIGMIASIN